MRLLLAEKNVTVPEDADAKTLLRLAVDADFVPDILPDALAELFDAAGGSKSTKAL